MRPRAYGNLAHALVAAVLLVVLSACAGPNGAADTPLKKWAVAQTALTAATDATADALRAGVIDLGTARELRDKLDWAQEALDFAHDEIRKGGVTGDILPLIQRAAAVIDEVLAQTTGGG